MLSEKAKVLGDAPASPSSGDSTWGMSYRQWLVGQILTGSAGKVTLGERRQVSLAEMTADAFDLADAALERQAQER